MKIFEKLATSICPQCAREGIDLFPSVTTEEFLERKVVSEELKREQRKQEIVGMKAKVKVCDDRGFHRWMLAKHPGTIGELGHGRGSRPPDCDRRTTPAFPWIIRRRRAPWVAGGGRIGDNTRPLPYKEALHAQPP